MRILVTGGAGYIGSHAVRALAKRGHDVRIYDNLCAGHRELVHGFELVKGDISNRVALLRALKDVDAVMHFAAHAYVGESVERPRKYFANNVLGGLTLLDAVIDSGIDNFVFSSTCAVYGVPPKNPIAEDTPRQPVNPYGASKLFFENALEAYGRAYGLRYAILRYFNAAGADESGDIGELHEPETHLIPCILQVAAGVRDRVDIFGDDYPTPDGSCIRDYIHVNDLANAHACALDLIATGAESFNVNLGSSIGYSVMEVVSAVENVIGRVLPRRICPRRPGDPAVLVADTSRAESLLQWRATRSLHDIVDGAWRWMQRIRSHSTLSA
jgi:UDP-glucose-4-epimerase GalE